VKFPHTFIGNQNLLLIGLRPLNFSGISSLKHKALTKDFSEFIGLLNKNRVEYLVIGGYAVAYHGYPRFTGDLDIWFNPTEQNSEKLLEALTEFGFGSVNIQKSDLLKSGNIIQLGYPPIRIDLINHPDGIEFSDCFLRRDEMTSEDGMKIYYIGLSDLIVNKKASGRHRDLDDLQNLPEG